jgi:hypothetical protein
LALDLVAIAVNVVPVFGGVVSNILNNWSADRKRDRIRRCLGDVSLHIANTRSKVNEEYVRSDEFEDLADQTLRRVAMERSEEKRRIYAAFLAGTLTGPGEPYHEQLRFLRTLEQLQPDHIRVIRAMLQDEPSYASNESTLGAALGRLLPDISEDRLLDLVTNQLTEELRVLNVDRREFHRAGGAPMSRLIRPYGQRLIQYISAPNEGAR